MKLDDLISETMRVYQMFPNKYDERDSYMDLVEEVGELSQAMQISSGRKHTNDPKKQRNQEDVEDAICDVLFQLIRLADQLGVDLEEEYPKVLKHIEKRLNSGEFKKG